MNGHWNPYSAFNANGSSRGKSHSTKSFKKAWKRFSIIVRGGPRDEDQQAACRTLDMPRLLQAKSNDDKIYNRLGVPKIAAEAEGRADVGAPDTGLARRARATPRRDYYPGGKYVDWVGADAYAKFSNSTLWNNLNAFYRKYD